MDRASGGWVGIVRDSLARFSELRGPEASASLAYYALFSIFPLTLVVVALLGFVLTGEQAYRQTLAFIVTIFPFSGDLVGRNLTEVTEQRGTIGLIGVLGALWAASGFFTTLARHINRAWPAVKLRGLVQSRLFALAMIGALLFLLVVSLISSTIISLLPVLYDLLGGEIAIFESTAYQILLRFIPAVFTFLMFLGLYRWVPNKVVRWKAVLTGALIITIIWELAKSVFTLYLRSGFARFDLFYGSLGTLIVLMVWIYASNVIALFGAYLVATQDLRTEQEHKSEKPDIAPHKGPRG